MVALPRELEKWLLSLDLRNPIHRPKWDMANGCAVAEILSVYHPRKVLMDVFETGLSMSAISLNWIRVQEMLAKLDVVVPPGIVDGIRNFKDGAAELLLEELYGHFTGRRIDKLEAARQIDFTDHAYQMSLPYVARSTASQVVKRNIRFSEVVSCQQPNRLAWRATRLLGRHARDRDAERRADPQRFDRCPSLAERALRRSPPPACVSPTNSSTSCLRDVDDDRNESRAIDTDDETKDENSKKTLCTADNRKPAMMTNRTEEVLQPMPPAAAPRQCLQSAVPRM